MHYSRRQMFFSRIAELLISKLHRQLKLNLSQFKWTYQPTSQLMIGRHWISRVAFLSPHRRSRQSSSLEYFLQKMEWFPWIGLCFQLTLQITRASLLIRLRSRVALNSELQLKPVYTCGNCVSLPAVNVITATGLTLINVPGNHTIKAHQNDQPGPYLSCVEDTVCGCVFQTKKNSLPCYQSVKVNLKNCFIDLDFFSSQLSLIYSVLMPLSGQLNTLSLLIFQVLVTQKCEIIP